ncbi:MAG: major intrinsic protein [Ramlibacter sp.]|uniref:aquaporin n=1 Tax=Ramlibacter sp. TaxID=1917967 RepID=UPI0026027C61|nr:aquaporin [Ramlibacter sp.]MDB5750409.1 major intrinsic protein [Ramlibacter sp.]
MKRPLAAALLAEFLGTAGLLCAVIGSGIMAERLSGGNVGITLLANTLATVFALYVLIEVLAPVSGAHFNPVVTLALFARRLFSPAAKAAVPLYIVAQLSGAAAGAWLANAMFELQLVQLASKVRGGWGQWLGEFVATAGLMVVILRAPAGRGAGLVACYIGAAYWFTSSTSFANPAAVAGRMLSDSFAGIAPQSALGFVGAELAGGAAGCLVAWALGRQVVEVEAPAG